LEQLIAQAKYKRSLNKRDLDDSIRKIGIEVINGLFTKGYLNDSIEGLEESEMNEINAEVGKIVWTAVNTYLSKGVK
jgi:hypothetical protein